MGNSYSSSQESARQGLADYVSGGGSSALQSAITRYDNNQGLLDRLGAVPRAGMGLLSKALAPLDYLGGISRAQIFTNLNNFYRVVGLDEAMIDINKDGDTSNDSNYFRNFKRAALKNPFDPNQRIAGFGDTPAFKWKEGDSFITKALKGTVAFAGDVGSDPLTYLTAGFGPLAKKAAVKAVAGKTAAEAGEIFLKEIAEKGSREGAETILKNSERIANKALESIADEGLSNSQKVAKYVSQMSADDLAREAGEEVGARATSVFRGPGKKALRTYFDDLAKETGVDDLRGLFEKQVDDVRGGFRITSPTGKTWVRLTEGGVSPFEPLRAKAGAKFGATKVGQALTLGAERGLQQGAKTAAAQLAKEAAGSEAFSTVLRKAATHEATITTRAAAGKAGRGAATQIAREAQEVVANYQAKIGELDKQIPGTGARLRELTDKYIQEFDLPDVARSFDKDGVVRVAVPEAEKDLHQLAVDYARKMIDSDTGNYIAYRKKLGGAFSEAGVRQGPARVMTKEAQDFAKQVDASSPARKSTGKFKAAENYFTIDPDTGLRRRMTLNEANDAVRQNLLKRGFTEEQIPKKWFETDASAVYMSSMDKIARRVEKVSPIKALRDKGLLVGAETVGGIDPKVVDERAAKTIRDLADQIDQALRAGNRVQADEILADANELQSMVDEAWSLAGSDQNNAFGAVMEQIVKLKGAEARRIESALGATAPEAKAVRAAYTRMKNELTKNDKKFAEMLFSKTRLGSIEGADGRLIEIQDEFMNLFAEKELAVSLTNAVRKYREVGPAMQQLQAQLSAWRRAATIGRGPAFVFRNLGTWWNAFVAGAGRVDFSDGIEYMRLRESAIREYQKVLPTIEVSKLSTASVVDATKDVASEGQSLLDQILKEKMAGKKFGEIDMWEAHQMMERQGIFGSSLTDTAIGRDEQGMPEEITGRSIVGRGRSSVFSQTRKGEVIPLKTLKRRGLTLKDVAKSGELRPVARTVDAAVNNKYMYGVAWMSEQSEVWLRASSFATGLRRYGGDEVGGELAGLLTKATQFDYQDMSEFERRYVRQVAPFYIWTKNNVPFQLRALVDSPGKVNMVLRANETAKELLGSDDPESNAYLPGWITEQLGFASKLKSGENDLALSLNLPLADLNRFVVVPESLPTSPGALKESLGAVIGGTRDDAVGSLNPFAKALMESITGTNTFTQTKFTDQAAGPLYSLIPGATWINPENGRREGSGFAQAQIKNLIPFFGQAERLLPGEVGRDGVQNDRLLGNWLSQATSFSPLAVSATLNDTQLTGELRARNVELEARIKKEARKLGITTEELRAMYDEESSFSRLFGTGSGDDASFARAFMKAKKNRDRALAAALAP